MERNTVFTIIAVSLAAAALAYMFTSGTRVSAEDVIEELDEETQFEPKSAKAESIEDEKPIDEKPAAAAPAEAEPEDPRVLKMRQFGSAQSLGSKYYKGQNFARAASEFSSAIALAEELKLSQEKIETLYNNRSAVYEKDGKLSESLADCQVVIAMNRGHAKVRARMARVYQAQNRLHEALIELTSIMLLKKAEVDAKLAQFGDNPQVRQMMAQQMSITPPEGLDKMMQIVGKADVETFMADRDENFLKGCPPSPNAVNQLLLCYKNFLDNEREYKKIDMADVTDKLKVFEGKDVSADEAETLVLLLQQRVMGNMIRRKYSECKTDLTRAVQVLKAHPSTLEGAALCELYCWAGFFEHMTFCMDEAMALYDLAEAADPSSVDVHVKRSGVAIDKGDIDAAEQHINRAAQLSPAHTDVYMHRAQIWVIRKDWPKAEDDLRACIASYPRHTLAQLRLSTILMQFQRFSEAAGIAEDARKNRPKLSEVHQVLGEISVSTGDVESGMQSLEEAIRLDPSNAMPHVDKGLALLQTQMNHMLALEEFNQAIQADKFCTLAYLRSAELQLSFATDFDVVRKVITDMEQALNLSRDKEELQELCMVRAVAVAQLEAAIRLGMTSFGPGFM